MGETEPIDGFSAKKIRHNFLTNPLEEENRFYKLLLSDTDQETLKAVVRNAEYPKEHSIRIRENFEFFLERITDKKTSIEQVCRGVAKLMIVDIALEREQDNPQLIFESMNSTGKALSEADLIRNYILMGLEPKLQTEIYQDLWRPMEVEFGQEAYGDQFDDFMRHYLTIKMGDIPRQSEVYEAFKEYSQGFYADGGAVRALVEDIRKYSQYFVYMALGAEKRPRLKTLFDDLFVDMNYTVAMPFLMEVYSDFQDDHISEEQFVEIITLVESYVFRRSICQIPTNSMNKTFAEFTRHIDKESYLPSLKAHFAHLRTYRRFPTNDEFEYEFSHRNVYKYSLAKYLLRKIENFGKKELVSVENYSIEHVMPQNENLSAEWQKELGVNWKEIQEKYLHTIGNLTLTGYNPEYSDKPFAEKKNMKKGFLESPLKLNASIAKVEHWNEDAIVRRGKELGREAVQIWPYLSISEAEVAKFKPKQVRSMETATFTVNDNEYLSRKNVRELFEALRKEVLAIDPEVSETFLKHWIAYKAETNFVDVVPKAKGLRLSINMKYKEIHDPKGVTEDISGKGRWGNGEVSVHFRDMDELPYVITLIRQSYEKQMS
jgi:uncharacterized protein with ParB-like and HNH nuclease domain/predicted transport protein